MVSSNVASLLCCSRNIQNAAVKTRGVAKILHWSHRGWAPKTRESRRWRRRGVGLKRGSLSSTD